MDVASRLRTGLLPVMLIFGAAAQSQLAWPSVTKETRPWTRWWWMGSAVDKKDLTWNLEKYREAGLGGMELTPIYGVKGYESRFVNYLSPAWMGLFTFTLQEAKRLDLGLDMSTGTGWPFGGGPLIDSTYACKEMFWKTWTVRPGEGLADTVQYMQEPLLQTDGQPKPRIEQLAEPVFANKDMQALALFQVRFRRMLPLQTLMAFSSKGGALDLTSRVDAVGRLAWTAPAGEGDWTLYAIFQGMHGKMVERAAPGAEGNVIDHFSSVALKKYLSRFDAAFAGAQGSATGTVGTSGPGGAISGLRCFFNDSYEVDDSRGQSNWTPRFFSEFRRLRGYDLREHLPALFGRDSLRAVERVRCDYRETISDLLLQQFTIPWRDWAHSKGGMIRNQAHGSPANILDLYAASDIPETEGAEITRFKFATSAAHVMGKRLVSSESVTWLDEHFLSSLSDVKKALDNYFLGGVNHIFYHGTAYTPQDDPWPGWLFYAAVHFTPNDPSWQNFKALNQYVTRVQSFLQQGTPDNEILLYYPLYDSWSDTGRTLLKHYDRMEPEFRGTGFEECAEGMLKAGNSFDYISDKQLRGSHLGGLAVVTPGGTRYRGILLPDVRTISLDAFRNLLKMVEAGATVFVYKQLPSEVPGWYKWKEREDSLHRMLSKIHFKSLDVGEGVEEAYFGKGLFYRSDDMGALLRSDGVPGSLLVPDSLDFVSRNYRDGKVYFIRNKSGKKWAGMVGLFELFQSAAIFDPMTGIKGRAIIDVPNIEIQHLSRKGLPEIYLQLAPGGTCIVRTFDHQQIAGPLFPYFRESGEAKPVEGSWKIRFEEGGPALPATADGAQPVFWNSLDGEEVKDFSGTASYTVHFARPVDKAAMWRLDLGDVKVTAQVYLNGNKIATLIGPHYTVNIADSALHRENTLEVRVSNLMVNRIEDMDRKGIAWKKFYNYNFPPHERANRGANGLFDASKWAPLDSGMAGPVTLTPLAPVTAAGLHEKKK
jgi:hypothetical protein